MKKFIAILFISLSLIGALAPVKAQAAVTMTKEELAVMTITDIVSKEEISDKDIVKLEQELAKLDIDESVIKSSLTGEINANARGFNRWVDLGGGWKMQVHRPHGSDATKYHTHVKGKVGKNAVESKEALDGSSTHGKNNTMNDKKVPKSVQKKVKAHSDFKQAEAEEAKAKKAKKEIKAKKLNLNKVADVVIAIGIFIAVVGVVILAVTSTGGWAAILLAL